MSRIGVLGSGGVGQTLAGGFRTHGHDVRIGSRSPEKLEAFATAAGVGRGTFTSPDRSPPQSRLRERIESKGQAMQPCSIHRPTSCS